MIFLSFFVGGTLDRYEKKLDAVENGAFPPIKEVADFEQAIELTGNSIFLYSLNKYIFFIKMYSCRNNYICKLKNYNTGIN